MATCLHWLLGHQISREWWAGTWRCHSPCACGWARGQFEAHEPQGCFHACALPWPLCWGMTGRVVPPFQGKSPHSGRRGRRAAWFHRGDSLHSHAGAELIPGGWPGNHLKEPWLCPSLESKLPRALRLLRVHGSLCLSQPGLFQLPSLVPAVCRAAPTGAFPLSCWVEELVCGRGELSCAGHRPSSQFLPSVDGTHPLRSVCPPVLCSPGVWGAAVELGLGVAGWRCDGYVMRGVLPRAAETWLPCRERGEMKSSQRRCWKEFGLSGLVFPISVPGSAPVPG